MPNHVLPEEGRVPVAGEFVKTDLVIDDEEGRFVLAYAFCCTVSDCWDVESRYGTRLSAEQRKEATERYPERLTPRNPAVREARLRSRVALTKEAQRQEHEGSGSLHIELSKEAESKYTAKNDLESSLAGARR